MLTESETSVCIKLKQGVNRVWLESGGSGKGEQPECGKSRDNVWTECGRCVDGVQTECRHNASIA